MKTYDSKDNETKNWTKERDEEFILDYIKNHLSLLEERDAKLKNL